MLARIVSKDFEGKKIGEVLLTPTKIYVKTILNLIEKFQIKGMAHITGGGFIENIPRMFKSDFTAVIHKNSYDRPEIFNYLISLGVDEMHMYNTYNMGIGFVICVNKEEVSEILEAIEALGDKAYEIGYVALGGEGVCLK